MSRGKNLRNKNNLFFYSKFCFDNNKDGHHALKIIESILKNSFTVLFEGFIYFSIYKFFYIMTAFSVSFTDNPVEIDPRRIKFIGFDLKIF